MKDNLMENEGPEKSVFSMAKLGEVRRPVLRSWQPNQGVRASRSGLNHSIKGQQRGGQRQQQPPTARISITKRDRTRSGRAREMS
ncbi:hypothetical protein RRG08_009411 [Elysia crispata]|uniref:Uncharacterized protein n=1 Tax=Elysia crispata TaxID=231223 RepID=A0AAE0Y8S7_9GAST|nr:hypothetical protein RRG08_009411 [Elysia crispata]